ncbi:MAG: C40 family peptidase [Clostridiales bacterium]|nr:C40 family peptidase [Clostridiales bacterium]
MHNKRKLAGAAVIAAALLFHAPSEARAEGNKVDNTKEKLYGIAKVETCLNIREGAGTGQKILGTMSSGAICRITGGEDGWFFIEYGNQKGFVSSEYLVTAKKEELEEKEAEVKEQLRGQTEDADGQKEKTGWSSGEETGQGKEIVDFAVQFQGNPYEWGGTSLTEGADCSGFVQSVFAHFDISLPRTSRQQSQTGNRKEVSEAQPGDLIFYEKDGRIYHVVIYMGEDQVIHASCEKEGIRISSLNHDRAVWAASYLT